MSVDRKNIACLFGSFDPIHYGHIHLVESVLENIEVDEVWIVVSPQNPFKVNKHLTDEYIRLDMVSAMINNNDKIKLCDIEFELTRPSYTNNTIEALSIKYPENDFSIIIGSDALNNIKKWESYENVVKIPIISFIRDGVDIRQDVRNVIDNLIIMESKSEISSTFIRDYINNFGLDSEEILNYLNSDIVKIIKDNNLYNK